MEAVEQIGLLSTLASIAAAMVGFTGLLTAFKASTDSLSPNDVSNIRILLIFSVSALVFALLPIPLLAFDAHSGWFGLLTGLLGAFLLLWLVQSPRWMRRKRLRPRNPRLYWTMLIAQAALGMVLLAAALLRWPAEPFYVTGVMWCLVTAIVVFVVQVFVMLPIGPSEN